MLRHGPIVGYFKKEFGPLLKSSLVGFCGGQKSNPTYDEVCRGTTGHAEAIQLTYEPGTIEYAKLVEHFYRMHDPTQQNG